MVSETVVYLEPYVYWSPQSHGVSRRSHHFKKKFPKHSIVWVQDHAKWLDLSKEHPIQIYVLKDGILEEK